MKREFQITIKAGQCQVQEFHEGKKMTETYLNDNVFDPSMDEDQIEINIAAVVEETLRKHFDK
jgi:hypothetical protein